MERRVFCVRACQTTSLAALASVLGGCNGPLTFPTTEFSLPVVQGSRGSGGTAITIDARSPLAAAGGAALVDSTRSLFLVVRMTEDRFIVLGAVCTHDGCTITEFRNETFVCTCHGSRFDTDGLVLQGPARQPLPRYSATFDGTVLTISA